MVIFWKILCILLLSSGAAGIGLGISKLDIFLISIGLLLLVAFLLALHQYQEDLGIKIDTK